MTDKLKGLYVAFDHDIREDDAVSIINAIKAIRGVGAVTTSVTNPDDYMNRTILSREYKRKLIKLIQDI